VITTAPFQGSWFVPGGGGGDSNDEFVFWVDGLPFASPFPASTSEFTYWDDGLPFNGDEN
jgi:hypothetical protein